MLTIDSINPLTEAIQLAVAPVFLLTGVQASEDPGST